MSTNPAISLKQHITNDGTERKEVSGTGNGLFATRDFAPRAQILFVQRPLISALESTHLESNCYACLRARGVQESTGDPDSEPEFFDLKACTGCRTVRFCDKSCQKKAWSAYHKHECKIFATLHPYIFPSTPRAAIRLLLQRKHGLLPSDEWTSLLAMKSHQDDLLAAGGERWKDICNMSQAIHAYSRSPESAETILRICCIMMVNSFTLTSTYFDPIGIALHPLPALMNHSCDPNAYVRFDITSSSSPAPTPKICRGSISVHALRPILAGDEIRVTYIDATVSQPHRHAELLSRYFFTCTCPACTHPFPSTYVEDDAQDDAAIAAAVTLLQTTSDGSSHPANITKTAPEPSPDTIPGLVRAIKSLSLSGSLSRPLAVHDYPLPQLRHQVILALLAACDFREAMRQNALLCFRAEVHLYKERHHPMRLISLWRLFKLACFVNSEPNYRQNGSDGDVLAVVAWLLCELLEVVLPDVWKRFSESKGGERVRLVVEEREGEAETRVPIGQFEVLVYQNFVEFVEAGDGWVLLRDVAARREYWDGKMEKWVDMMVGKVLAKEGRDATEGRTVLRR